MIKGIIENKIATLHDDIDSVRATYDNLHRQYVTLTHVLVQNNLTISLLQNRLNVNQDNITRLNSLLEPYRSSASTLLDLQLKNKLIRSYNARISARLESNRIRLQNLQESLQSRLLYIEQLQRNLRFRQWEIDGIKQKMDKTQTAFLVWTSHYAHRLRHPPTTVCQWLWHCS